MATQINKLSDRKAKGQLLPGRHSDGAGLYLNVSDGGARSWVFMWKTNGRRREMGLGSLNAVSLSTARELAEKARRERAAGYDPIALRDASVSKTFGEVADELIASMSPTWRNPVHRAQWKMTLSVYCAPIRGKQVATIGVEDVLKILNPLWQTKAETAGRLRGRIERVLDFAKARGWRSGENPALWRGHLDAILPKRAKLTRGHHAAMPYDRVPAFLATLRGKHRVPALALEFTILTACRTNEALGSRWEEFDADSTLWTVPGSRMKGGRDHRVPLSDRAREILVEARKLGSQGFVFPGAVRGKPLTNVAMAKLLKRMEGDFTVHGFRSSFRDWAGEATAFPREIAEAALAHLVGDETERAYRRGDAIEKRRKLMDAWAQFCADGHTGAEIVSIADHNRRQA